MLFKIVRKRRCVRGEKRQHSDSEEERISLKIKKTSIQEVKLQDPFLKIYLKTSTPIPSFHPLEISKLKCL